jgi:formamidopyrimidine-DNA glycosylase
MPELPAVERARRMIDALCKSYRRINVQSAPDPKHASEFVDKLFEGRLGLDLLERRVCVGHVLRQLGRHGKNLWFEFDEPPHVFVRFRMAGSFVVRGHEDGYVYETFRRRTAACRFHDSGTPLVSVWPPKHTHIVFSFAPCSPGVDSASINGISVREVAVVDPRKVARMRLSDSSCPSVEIRSLIGGFDALHALPPIERFERKMLVYPKANIKSLLLGQRFIAGLDNWMVDEVLYYAHIHPESRTCDLTRIDVAALHQSIAQVVRSSCDANADLALFP